MKRLFLAIVLMMAVQSAWAQGCAMCTKTAAELDDKSARGLNGGILYLAAVPLTILGTIGFVWWKHNRKEEL